MQNNNRSEFQAADLSDTIEGHVHLLPQVMLHLSPQLLLLLTQITESFLTAPPGRSGRENGRIRTIHCQTVTVIATGIDSVTYKVCHCITELLQLLLKVKVLVGQCLNHLFSSQSSIHLGEGGQWTHYTSVHTHM